MTATHVIRVWLASIALASAATSGCSCALSHGGETDAGQDMVVDTGTDAGFDVGGDAGVDAPRDVGNDASDSPRPDMNIDAWRPDGGPRPDCHANLTGCPAARAMCCFCGTPFEGGQSLCYERDVIRGPACDTAASAHYACSQDCTGPYELQSCVERRPDDARSFNCAPDGGLPEPSTCPSDRPICCGSYGEGLCVAQPLVGWYCAFPEGGMPQIYVPPPPP